ncbi:FmdB family zinc ribbon protein [Chloroflexus sp.]|uniref:FmdB family zinc ribbon protein n=1 Tax=Chloroflexus sp. TaxID=1904827 RepID=UPI00404AABD1
MPTYVYACDACGKQFEQFQSFKDEPLTVCLCGQAGRVRRVIQPVGIVFKGSGWYITDSRGSSSGSVTSSDAGKDNKSDTGDD